MKKLALALSLIGIIGLSYCTVAHAASITVTKPSIQLNTDNEESAVSKKIKEVEQSKNELKAKQAQKEKEAKEKRQQRKDAIDSFKDSFK